MSMIESVSELLSRMTLDEKIGQMTQVEKNSISPQDVNKYFIGSVLSGGGGYPAENNPQGWVQMVGSFQAAALDTRLGIPILYGVDAVHGHNNLRDAVLFPHNIALGATGDPELAYQVGRATAKEMAATGVYWNFAPTMAVPQDIRWGRTFEGYGQDSQLVALLGSGYIQGLQDDKLSDPLSVLATPKHYLADGGTKWGSSKTLFPIPPGFSMESENGTFQFMIDQGDAILDEATLRRVHLMPYISAIKAGAKVVMASFSSWNGIKLHAHHYLLTKVLKDELGFEGFVVSDWGGISQVSDDYYQAVVASINAGVDMSMVPHDFKRFISTLKRAVENGDVVMRRIDDAVLRILRVKFLVALFDRPLPNPEYINLIGAEDHRKLAREAVARSLVLLKNEAHTLPLSKSTPRILVAGPAADDIGLQCGGWTIDWLGKSGPITAGTTLLDGMRAAASAAASIDFHPEGFFDSLGGEAADVGIVVISEMPYAEGFGDREDLRLALKDTELLGRMRMLCRRLVMILISGRPLVLSDQLPLVDSLVAAWLPGTEGDGVADVLFGDKPFTGRLPCAWPTGMEQIPMPADAVPLFPFGYGLQAG